MQAEQLQSRHITQGNPEAPSHAIQLLTLSHTISTYWEADLTGARHEGEGAKKIHALPKEVLVTFKRSGFSHCLHLHGDFTSREHG